MGVPEARRGKGLDLPLQEEVTGVLTKSGRWEGGEELGVGCSGCVGALLLV